MKKWLSMLMILIVLLSTSACGAKNDDDEDDDSGSSRKTSSVKDKDTNVDDEDRDSNDDEDSSEDEDSNDDEDSNVDEDGDYTTYTSEDGHLSFTYPSEWIDNDQAGAEKILMIGYTGDNFLLVTENLPSSFKGDLADYVDLSIENLEANPDITVIDSYEEEYNGYEAGVVIFNTESDDMSLDQMGIIFKEGDAGYNFVYTSVEGDIEDNFADVIEPVLDTVEID